MPNQTDNKFEKDIARAELAAKQFLIDHDPIMALIVWPVHIGVSCAIVAPNEDEARSALAGLEKAFA